MERPKRSNNKSGFRGDLASFRIPSVERYLSGCPDRYMITLTTKRRLDEIAMSREVSELFHRANAALYGTHYTRRKSMRLVTLAVQERSIDQGLHTHVLVGVPDGSLGLKTIPCRTSVPTLITNTWVALDERGRRSANAQDSQDIYDLEGARRYVMKTIRSAANLIDYDFLNTIAPDA